MLQTNVQVEYILSSLGNTPQSTNYTVTCLPSRKLYKLDEPDMQDRDELISDVLLWTPTYGRAKAGRPARTYIQQLCEDSGCSPEDMPEAMNDREKWRERVRDIRAGGTTWWWWWWNINIVVSEFEVNSRFYVHFRIRTMNPFIPLAMGWIVPLLFL